MTNSSRKFMLALGMSLVPLAAFAQTQPAKPATPPPPARARPVIVNTPARTQQFQQQMSNQQLQNSQRQSQVQQQIRQSNVDTQRTNVTDPAMRTQLDNADATRRRQQQVQQQPLVPAGSSSAGR